MATAPHDYVVIVHLNHATRVCAALSGMMSTTSPPTTSLTTEKTLPWHMQIPNIVATARNKHGRQN
jgi:hypothetical protein